MSRRFARRSTPLFSFKNFDGRSIRFYQAPNAAVVLHEKLLGQFTDSCEAAGLEIYLGVLHEYRPGRPSLACDIMEPLRIPAVDRWVISLCNQNRIAVGDFQAQDGGIRLQSAAFGRILRDWEEHWINGGQEQVLDQWIEQFIGQLRQWAVPASGSPETPDEQAL